MVLIIDFFVWVYLFIFSVSTVQKHINHTTIFDTLFILGIISHSDICLRTLKITFGTCQNGNDLTLDQDIYIGHLYLSLKRATIALR